MVKKKALTADNVRTLLAKAEDELASLTEKRNEKAKECFEKDERLGKLKVELAGRIEAVEALEEEDLISTQDKDERVRELRRERSGEIEDLSKEVTELQKEVNKDLVPRIQRLQEGRLKQYREMLEELEPDEETSTDEEE